MITTIQIDKSLKEKLDNLKVHHRETYNELILRLLENFSPKESDRESLIETIEILSDPETMRELAGAVERCERREGIPFEQIKKENGI